MHPALSRRTFIGGIAALPAMQSFAQSPPGSIIVPFTAGFLADVVARKYAISVAELGGGPFVVENIVGASGLIAARQTLNRPADGRTLLWANSGLICNAPLLAKTPLDFEPATDLVPVSIFLYTRFVLFAAGTFGPGNLQELQKLARSRKEPLTYVAGEAGSANHVAMELLLKRLDVPATFIPYRNFQQAFIDVAEGRVDVGVFGWNNIGPLAGSGKAKVLAVLADQPLTAEPRHTTVPAQGFGPFDLQGWIGVFVARNTPPAVIAELEKSTEAVLRQRAFLDFAVGTGQEVVFRSHAESKAFVASEVERYRTVLKSLKLI